MSRTTGWLRPGKTVGRGGQTELGHLGCEGDYENASPRGKGKSQVKKANEMAENHKRMGFKSNRKNKNVNNRQVARSGDSEDGTI